MHSFRQPFFWFSPNPLDTADPMLHLFLYNEEEASFYEHRLGFREAFEFCARLSQEVAAIALRNPALRNRVKIRDVDMDPPAEASTNSYKSKRGVLARILGRE